MKIYLFNIKFSLNNYIIIIDFIFYIYNYINKYISLYNF